MKPVAIGIKSQDELRARMLSIARGEYKPKASEPRIWFTSMRSLAEVLSEQNRALLKLISENNPASITSLAELTGRRTSNLSRTLKTMANYGLIEMQREKNQVRPVAKATEFRIVA